MTPPRPAPSGRPAPPRADTPLPTASELLPGRTPRHPALRALLPEIRVRLAAPPGSAVAYYEDSPRDGV